MVDLHTSHLSVDLEQAKSELDRNGFCLIPSVLIGKELSEARSRLVTQAAAEERAGLDFRDSGQDQPVLDDYGHLKPDAFSVANGGVNQRMWMLMNKGRCFRDMVTHPIVDALIGHILGPRFLLSTHSANIAKSGGKRMGLHTDQWWMPQPVRPEADHVRPSEISRVPAESAVDPDPTLGISPAVVANTMWMLSDFTLDNGATEVVRGSHLSGAQPHPTDQGEYPVEQMVGTAGTLAVFDGRLWHGTGAHSAGEDRLGVLATFCAPQFRQQENQILGLDPNLWPTLSDKLKERLGFKPWNAYGRVESPAAPWVELEPERISELS
jgi:ectoine hydroxylase-related dioxygenase (phytanoyl-CoA dioxygenase family)